MTQCHICANAASSIFVTKVLQKYDVTYHRCHTCGFVQAEDPYWLDEAYARPINVADTGALARNYSLSKIMSVLIYSFFDRNGHFLDYGGGYGIFTRLMRDIGFDFKWKDPYCKNIFAEGFEHQEGSVVELVTSLENFEHFVHPLKDIEKISACSANILFTTQLLPNPVPAPNAWWYYGFEHGQHISFYTIKSLQHIASKLGVNFVSDGKNLHLFSRQKISQTTFRLTIKAARKLHLARYVSSKMQSLTCDDMKKLM